MLYRSLKSDLEYYTCVEGSAKRHNLFQVVQK